MARTYGFSIIHPEEKETKKTNEVKTKSAKDLIKSGKYTVAEITLIQNKVKKIKEEERGK